MNKQVFIDSINEKYARLLYEDEEFVLPVSLLPKEAKEGNILSFSFEILKEKTEESKKECNDLLSKLLAGNNE